MLLIFFTSLSSFAKDIITTELKVILPIRGSGYSSCIYCDFVESYKKIVAQSKSNSSVGFYLEQNCNK